MKYLVAVIMAVAASSIVACSGENPQSAPPPIGSIPHIETPTQIERPIFPYTVTAAQATTIENAVRIGTESCMKGFGFSLDLPAPPDNNAFVLQGLYRSFDYGFFDPASDPSKGYDTAAATQQLDFGILNRMPTDERAVLEGTQPNGRPLVTFHGMPVPTHGCGQAGLDAVGGKVPTPQDPRALPDNGPVIPAADPRIISVDKQWSDCMQRKGFHYTSPWDAYTDARWRQTTTSPSAPHSVQEIATATADLACKQSVNLVGIAVAVESAYDQQYIASHRATLQHFKQGVDLQMRQASAFIAAHPSLP